MVIIELAYAKEKGAYFLSLIFKNKFKTLPHLQEPKRQKQKMKKK